MTLRAVFEDPRTTTRDPSLLADRARVTLKSARAFLRTSAASQISQVSKKPPDAAYAPTGGHEGEYLADVIYLRDYSGANKHRGAILTLLGVNSRYAYARGLVMDASDKNRGVSSAKTALAMKSILAESKEDKAAPIAAVRADGGPEFKGEFAALLEKNGITLERGQAGTHERLARLDRFHGTLRRMIGDLFALTNSHVWYPYLDLLIENYNERPNRALDPAGEDLAPKDITFQRAQLLRRADSERAALVRSRTNRSGIRPGTMVRLLNSRTAEGQRLRQFGKAHEQAWTSEIYPVIARAGPNSFLVDVPKAEPRVWPVHDLRAVPTGTVSAPAAGEKVNKKVVAAQRAEYQARSGPEQRAALAAVEDSPAPAGPLKRSGRIAKLAPVHYSK